MNKKRMLLPLFVMVLLTGCQSSSSSSSSSQQHNNDNPQTLVGEKAYQLGLSSNQLLAKTNTLINLPEPVLLDNEGTTYQEEVYVTIYDHQNEIYTPKYLYDICPYFTAHQEGQYSLKYETEVDHQTLFAYATIDVSNIALDRNIVIDGLKDEGFYPYSYQPSENDRVTVSFHFIDTGFYVHINVIDDNIIYSTYTTNKFMESDGVELLIDLAAQQDDFLNDNCLKIQFNAGGLLWIMQPQSSKTAYELNERVHLQHSWAIFGTVTEADSEDILSFNDIDSGYQLELFVPYQVIGVDSSIIGDQIAVAIAHRDVSYHLSEYLNMKSGFNNYYSDVAMPEGLIHVTCNNGINYFYSNTANDSFTSRYTLINIQGGQNNE